MKKLGILFFFFITLTPLFAQYPSTPSPVISLPGFGTHTVNLENGKSLTLNLPGNLDLFVAAQGMKCPRFMTFSPDHRLFVAGLYNRSDTKLGRIYLLEDFDPLTGTFGKVITYLDHLHNPNSVAFYTDTTGQSWIYVT